MNFSQISVLIVDANKNMQNIVREIVHGFGTKSVFLSDDGADALEFLKHTEVDIIICDLEMTPVDGYEFLRFLRRSSDSPAKTTPVIVLSGQAERNRIIAARDAGAHEFVVKPVSPKVLRKRIEAVLEQPRDFVRSRAFVGPDRRRRDNDNDSPERRSGRIDKVIKVE